MSTNLITCDFMDEVAATHAFDGSEVEHDRHDAAPDFGTRVDYEDGEITRHGYGCVVCHHVTDESGRFHTDPRLDKWAVPAYALPSVRALYRKAGRARRVLLATASGLQSRHIVIVTERDDGCGPEGTAA